MSRLTELQEKYEGSLSLDPQPWEYDGPDSRPNRSGHRFRARYPLHVIDEGNIHLVRWNPRQGFERNRDRYDGTY